MKKLFRYLSLILVAALLVSPVSLLGSVTADAASGKWVAAWATSLVNGSIDLDSYVSGFSVQDLIPARSTIRTELTVATSGSMLKFKFSNQYGTSPMTIDAASVAKTGDKTARILTDTQVPITFNNGQTSVTIPAGKTIWSDSVGIKTEALEKVSISLYFKSATRITSTGLSGGQTYLSTKVLGLLSGGYSQVDSVSLSLPSEINITSGTITYHTIPFLANINTYTTQNDAYSVVFIGDSTLVNNTFHYFAAKVVKAGYNNIGIVNEAVIGNKLLSDGTGLIGNLYGEALIDRFERDVLSIDSARYVIVKIGLNDILHQFSKSLSASTPAYTTNDIIAGYEKLVSMAHAHGIKIYFVTKSAWNGYSRAFLGQTGDLVWSQEAQNMCDSLNFWIKTNSSADGYIDASPLANPSDTTKLCSTLTLDGAHLSELGSVALADLIPLSLVGVNVNSEKTAAKIFGVDPYAEKRQIIYEMEHGAPEPTTAAPQGNTTPEATTAKPASANEATTAKPAEATTRAEEKTTVGAQEPTAEFSTVPYTVPSDNPTDNSGLNTPVEDVSYNVSDENLPDKIGSGASIGIVLIVFMAVVVAGAVIILTVGRKKETFE